MGRWLARLRQDEKNTETLRDGTDKTDKTPSEPVLSVLSVRQPSETENSSGALDIGVGAKRRLADEYDAAQERGEIGQSGARKDLVPVGNEVVPSAADIGLSRKGIHEARIARDVKAAAYAGRFEDRPANWMPEPGPGVRILRPAVEVSAAEYDRHLVKEIAALPAGSPEAYRLSYAKKKGWCVDRGGERIFTRGRF